jgi:hypothetical protein
MAEEESKSFKKLIEEQRKTTAAVEKSMMTARERADLKAAEDEKFKKRSEASTKGAETKRLNALNKQDPSSAANKEKEKESNSYLRDTFGKFLGKNSSFAKGFASIGKSLSAKVKGGMDGIFKALKAGAFLLFLGGLVKFLQSPTFKELQDKYLPIIADGLQSLYDTLKFIAGGFFKTDPDTGKTTFSAVAGLSNIMSMITSSFLGWVQSLKDGFYDEEGNFSLTAGIKNLAGDFAVILTSIAAFGLLLAPSRFFGTLFQGVGIGGGLAIKALAKIATSFGSVFSSLTGFGTGIETTGTSMKDKVSKGKKTGIFSKAGKFGILTRFGRLFGKIGLFGGAIALAGTGMATLLTSGAAEGGVFAKIGTSFGKLFTKVGEFGTKIGTAVSGMATKLSTSLSAGVFSVANGIGTGFGKLFLEVSSFGSSISTTVKGMGASLANTTVFKTVSSGFSSLFGVLSDFGTKIAATAAKASAKVAKVAADAATSIAKIGSKVAKPTVKLSTKALDALRGTGEFALKPKIKPITPKLTSAQRSAMSGMGNFKFNPKSVAAATTTSAAKATTQATLKKGLWKSLAKKIPLLGVFAGTGFAIQRAMGGEYSKAFLEFASGVAGVFPGPGTAASIAIDAGLLADDLGISVSDAKKLIMANGGKVAKAEVRVGPPGSSGPMKLNQNNQTNDSNLVPNMAYDYNSDGSLSMGERRKAARGGMQSGPIMITAPSVTNNQNNIHSSPIVPLDPIMRNSISAM